MSKFPRIISRTTVENSEGEQVKICVRQWVGEYEVFVDGGFMHDGRECHVFVNLPAAMADVGIEAEFVQLH